MKIALASDHGGFELKEKLKKYLDEKGYQTLDLGTHSTESVDYPDYGRKCAETVAAGEVDRGIVICGSGIGISIAANRVHKARCALCTSVEMAKLSRQHNKANMLALGGRLTPYELAIQILDSWLETEFEGGRHQRRIDTLD